MERTSFLKFIQQKNEKYDVRKLSLQSMSTNTQQKSHNGIFNVESPAFNTQLPAFINRKVKNLKPYTNHFKRFNIQTPKITDSPKKWNEGNKVIINQNVQSQKIKSAKTSLLKQLGIGEQIKATEPMSKIPQISVYEQFLQKTSTMFTSSVIQNMYQTCVKKSAKLQQKENYQRSHRQQNQRNTENTSVPKNQRKSLGITSMKDYQQQNMSEKKGIKSMNQLPKSEETFLKTQKVCIIPNLTHFQHDDLGLQQVRNCAVMKKKSIPVNQPLRNQSQTIKKSQSKKSQRFKQVQKNEIQDCLDTSPNSNMNIQARNKKDKQSSQSYQRNKHTTTLTSQSPKKQDHRIKNTNFAPKTFQKSSFANNSGSQKPVKQSNQGLIDNASGNNKEQKQKSNTLEIPVPTNVTAASYIVYQPSFSQNLKFNKLNEQNLKSTNKIFSNNRILASLNCKAVAQIASLTKIMTFLLTLEICEKLKLDSESEKVRIGKFQANINGTSAQIKQGQIYTVQQLFYGLMLPSGNDASLALAIWAGKKLLIHELKQKQQNRKKYVTQTLITRNFSDGDNNDILQTTDQKKICLKKKKCYERFILQMNKKARALGMSKTTYANSHGLSNNLNKSCAFDLCILCEYCMHNEKFRKVVSTIEYKCSILYEQNPDQNQHEKKNSNPNHHIKVEEYQNNTNEQLDDVQHQNEHSDEESTQQLFDKQEIASERSKPFSVSLTNCTSQKSSQIVKAPLTYGERQVKWQNTHKLLSKEQYVGIKTGITNTAGPCLASCIKTKLNRCFIIIVLNSKKLNYRFKDTETLRKWVYRKEKIIQKVRQPQVQNQDQNIQEDESYNPEKQPSENLFMQTQK